MSQHTKEPWKKVSKGLILAQDMKTVIHASTSATDEAFENTDRIEACVNALAGIDDPTKHMEAYRACVEALGDMIKYFGNPHRDEWNSDQSYKEALNAVLASANALTLAEQTNKGEK